MRAQQRKPKIMDSLTLWSYRLGLFAAVGLFIGAMSLTALDLVAPAGTSGNRIPAETLTGIFAGAVILFGLIVFVGAIRKVRQMPLPSGTRILLMCSLVTLNFIGGYLFFLLYPRFRQLFEIGVQANTEASTRDRFER